MAAAGRTKSGSPDDQRSTKPTMPTGGRARFQWQGMPAAKPVSPVVPRLPLRAPSSYRWRQCRRPRGRQSGGRRQWREQSKWCRRATLSALAKRYGVSVADLQRANGIKDANVIYEGQNCEFPESIGQR